MTVAVAVKNCPRGMLAGTPVRTMSSVTAPGVGVGGTGVGVLVGRVRVAVGGGVPGVGVRVGVAREVAVRVAVGVGFGGAVGVGVPPGAVPVVTRTAIQSREKSRAVELAMLITRTRKLALESWDAVHERPQVSAAPPST